MNVTEIESILPDESQTFEFTPIEGGQRFRFIPCAVIARDEMENTQKGYEITSNKVDAGLALNGCLQKRFTSSPWNRLQIC